MSGIKALNKLRESSHLDDDKWTLASGDVVIMCGGAPDDPNAVNWGEQWRKIADEIEDEIAANYLELPKDINGERWSVTDKQFIDGTERIRELLGIEYDTKEQCWGLRYLEDGYLDTFSPYGCRHVKPRTLENVLCDALADASCAGDGIRRKFEPDEPYVTALADEIRAVFGEVDGDD